MIIRLLCALCLALILTLLCAGAALAQGNVDLTGATCLECHDNPKERGTVQVYWAGTGHPDALTALKASPDAADACLACHSADYVLAPAGAKPTLKTAMNGVTCFACHPGNHRLNVSSAIKDVNATCTRCHSEGRALAAGDRAHEPVAEMLAGRGALGLTSAPSEHAAVADCIKCHREGHKFTVVQRTCNGCHAGAKALQDTQAPIAAQIQTLKADLDRIAAANAGWKTTATSKTEPQKAYESAYTLYTFVAGDGSKGMHNLAYTRTILRQAQDALTKAGLSAPATLPKAGAALPGGVYLAGVLGLLGGVSLWAARHLARR
jgi:hypothetical protein